jgi:hypothetical protein
MNVFYLGVDNPVDVFAAGYQPEKIFAQSTNGSIVRQKDGSWIVRPSTTGNALIEILAQESSGKKISLGFQEFRVKTVPDPVAKIGGKKGGGISAQVLAAQFGIVADMENFDFELEFKVTEFTASANIRGFDKDVPVRGNRFSDEVKDLIAAKGKGNITFTDIKAVGPDGVPRPLNSIVFKMQ